MAEKRQEIGRLSYWQLVWRKFKRNRLTRIGMAILIVMYTSAIFADFLAPYGLLTIHDVYPLAPPQLPHILDAEGSFHRPFAYAMQREVDPDTFGSIYKPRKEERFPIRFLVHGDEYQFWGLFSTDIHLFGVKEPAKLFLFGTDKNGRDLFSRVLYGARVSLSIGLIGVFLSLTLGSLLGVASGFFGGVVDNITQRAVEVLQSFPRIPLWLAVAAAVPAEWSSIKTYFAVSVVLSLIGWAGLCRQVRGKVLALREENYVLAARAAGSRDFRIIVQHLFPNTLSHVLVVATLSIPWMILGETSLSFLGLGIQPPMTSWGVLLKQAQHTRVLLDSPWIVIPALFVIITVLAFNFVGDGLRDAADPYAR
ncbi:MAG: ABC transporter permease [Chloroflexota bacterium]|nr:ABC transporter permease [Chloroflexota bacterium]